MAHAREARRRDGERRRSQRRQEAVHDLHAWPADPNALMRMPDGEVLPVFLARIIVEKWEACERILSALEADQEFPSYLVRDNGGMV